MRPRCGSSPLAVRGARLAVRMERVSEESVSLFDGPSSTRVALHTMLLAQQDQGQTEKEPSDR